MLDRTLGQMCVLLLVLAQIVRILECPGVLAGLSLGLLSLVSLEGFQLCQVIAVLGRDMVLRLLLHGYRLSLVVALVVCDMVLILLFVVTRFVFMISCCLSCTSLLASSSCSCIAVLREATWFWRACTEATEASLSRRRLARSFVIWLINNSFRS